MIIHISPNSLAVLLAWAAAHPNIAKLHLFGSRASGVSEPWSDLDLAFEFDGIDDDLAELIENSSAWKAELSSLLGLVVKDLYLFTDLSCGMALVYERPIAAN
jgi:predicted nucleotidyltransferase